jgi:hypothetical protein
MTYGLETTRARRLPQMFSKASSLDQYNQLSKVDKDSLVLLTIDAPEIVLATADRQLEIFVAVKKWSVVTVVFFFLFFFAYFLGLPQSILGFIGGVLLFVFVGFTLGFLSYLLVEIVFIVVSKFFIDQLSQQKFKKLVEKKWMDLKSREKEELDHARNENQRVEAEIAQKYQKDFDSIVNYSAQGKSLLIPKKLLKFSVDELANVALSRSTDAIQQKNLSAEKRNAIVSYYRSLSSLLHMIADDEEVELEKTLNRINDLMQDGNIEESLKSDLLKEYARISSNALPKSSRDERQKLRYLEKFEEVFPSLNNGR